MKLTHLLKSLPRKNIRDVVIDSDITLVDICAFSGVAPGAAKISDASSFDELIGYIPAIASTIDLINWQRENVFSESNVNLIRCSKDELEKLVQKLDDAYLWRCKVKESIDEINGCYVYNADHDDFLNLLNKYLSAVKDLNHFFEDKIYDGPKIIINSSVEASKTDYAIVSSALGYSQSEGRKSVILTRDIDIPKIFIDHLDSCNGEVKERLLDNVNIYFVDKAGKEGWHFDPKAFKGRAKSFIWSLEKSNPMILAYDS